MRNADVESLSRVEPSVNKCGCVAHMNYDGNLLSVQLQQKGHYSGFSATVEHRWLLVGRVALMVRK